MAHAPPNLPTNQPDIGCVPPLAADRQCLRQAAGSIIAPLDKAVPPTLEDLEGLARPWLASLQMPAAWLGFAMVCLNNAFWLDAFANVPPRRRLLLLPHCLAHPEACRASADAMGLHCTSCGSCSIASIRETAESLGYRVIIAEGTGQLFEHLTSGLADAIVGVACMDSLGKSYLRLAEIGVPNLAVPLLADGCRNTQTDLDYLQQLLGVDRQKEHLPTRSYLPLLRQTRLMFEPPLFDTLLEGTIPQDTATSSMLTETDRLAFDYLRHGGKRLRPFAVLASYVVGKSGDGALCPSASLSELLAPAQMRVAIAVEALHCASLIHDDIEDDDDFRHARPTLHRSHGIPAAINLGDHLLGLGYRLIASQQEALGSAAVADMLTTLSRSHMELARGQGAELLWQQRPSEACSPADAIRLYTLKTSPAFEAALFCGLRMAGVSFNAEALRCYCTYLGTAFQIANDMDDWKVDGSNKRMRGGDALAGRPTLLHALASESAGGEQTQAILAKRKELPAETVLAQIEALYHDHHVFERAGCLMQRMAQRAVTVSGNVAGEPLARLLQSLLRLSVPQVATRL